MPHALLCHSHYLPILFFFFAFLSLLVTAEEHDTSFCRIISCLSLIGRQPPPLYLRIRWPQPNIAEIPSSLISLDPAHFFKSRFGPETLAYHPGRCFRGEIY
ncbi:hypothetical protein QBC45DRAFT_129878 [Copromyces sp. CBS 386.78]|nr:hypothetical protein QBC45DRAFT_129878 [Copromyces sp. CBS 386.78]